MFPLSRRDGPLAGRPRPVTWIALAVLALGALVALLVLENLYRDVARRSGATPDAPREGAHRVEVVLPGGRAAPAVRVQVTWVDADGSTTTTESLTGRDGDTEPRPPSPEARPELLRATSGPLVAEVPAAPFAARGSLAVELALPATFALAGRVREAQGGPVPAALVGAAGVTTVTDEHGAFELAELPAAAWFDGPLRLVVRSDDGPGFTWTVPRNHAAPFYEDLTVVVPPQ